MTVDASPATAEVVYLIGSPGGTRFKIGRSLDAAKRLADIQRMSPLTLEILWTTPGGKNLESAFHAYFSHLRTHGEWFDFGDLDPVVQMQVALGTVQAEVATPPSISLSAAEREILDAVAEFNAAPVVALARRNERIRAAAATAKLKQADVINWTGYSRETVRQALNPGAREAVRQAAEQRRAQAHQHDGDSAQPS